MFRKRIAWLCMLAALYGGCGNDSTTGRPVALKTEVALSSALETEFETGAGWRVSLNAAALSLAALYYFDGEPAFAARRTSSWRRALAELIGPRVAHAHPGHYVAGAALGQMLESAAVALSGDAVALPDGTGVTGTYRSGQLVFAKDDGALEPLAGAVARLAGRAEKGGKVVHFVLSASYEDVAQNAAGGAIRGCAFEPADVSGDGRIRLEIKPEVWLAYVQFDEVAEGSEDEPTEIAAGDDAQHAFAIGVAQLSAYQFSYRAETH